MTIQSIVARISPRYARKLAAKNTNVINKVKQQVSLSPEMLQKQEAVRNYVANKAINYKQGYASPPDFQEYKELEIDSDILHRFSAEDVISHCNGDIAKIDNLLGAYGLAKYSGLPIKEVLPPITKNTNLQVKETGYLEDDTLTSSANEYILENQHGELVDFFTRFGQVGKSAYKGFQYMGWVKTFFNLSPLDGLYHTYKVNNNFVSTAMMHRTARMLNYAHEDISKLL